MDFTKINLIAYRTCSIIILIFLLLGVWGTFSKNQNGEAVVGLIAGLVIGFLAFKRPSILYWILIIVVLFVAMGIVGYIKLS